MRKRRYDARKRAAVQAPRRKPDVPVLRIRRDLALNGVAAWARVRDFDRADPVKAQDGSPGVALRLDGKIVAGITCVDEKLRHAAEIICEAVLIRREDELDNTNRGDLP